MATEPPKQPASPPAGPPGPAGPAWSTLVGLLNILAGAGVLWLAWWVLSHFGRTLTLLGLAGVLAFLLEPAVSFLERGMRSRALAALLLYLAFVALLALGVVYLAGPIKEQAQELFWSVPRYRQQVAEAVPVLQKYMELLREFLARYGVSVEPQDLAGQFLQRVAGSTNRILAGLTAVVTGIGTTLANAVLVLVISIYLVVDGSGLNRQMLGYLPARYRRPVRRAQAVALRVFGGYLRGQLLLGLIIGVVVGIGLSLLGIPYPALLGVIAGVMELLPIVGAVLGAIPAILVALFQPWPAVLYVTLFFIVVQQVEGNLLVPRITGQAVGLHPLATLLALLAGYEVAGILGAILAVPVAAVAQALLREFNPPDPDPGEPGAGDNRRRPRRPSRAPRPVGAQPPDPSGNGDRNPGGEPHGPAGAGPSGPLPPERCEQEPAREGQDPPPPARGPRVVITRRPA
ncbi:AI-2E family transporter [Thermaerobacter subterraneus]|uniref:Permease n=1 Tax=Thermaerobacter subterraneus DSM 13965 TaxID=867903 RepID=K6P0J3_9FIRM|nr:AI-2E family transporter [Thermaerobacter subterraneus]EKP94620.1 putative permease [Thermaerobacter subterraneus DSM 13965]